MGHDRGDAAYVICLLDCDVCNANEDSVRHCKREVRYLYHTRNLATFYPWGDGQTMRHLVVYTESDWAGARFKLKGSSCAALQVDGCVLLVTCRGQQIRAQSSAGAEVCAAIMGMQEMLHVQELLELVGESERARLRMDSSAGRSVLLEVGLGRTRHLDVKVLWSQDQTCSGRVVIDKGDGGPCCARVLLCNIGRQWEC